MATQTPTSLLVTLLVMATWLVALVFGSTGCAGEEPKLDAPSASVSSADQAIAKAHRSVSVDLMTEDAGPSGTESPPPVAAAHEELDPPAVVPSGLRPGGGAGARPAPIAASSAPEPIVVDAPEEAEDPEIASPAPPATRPLNAHPTLEVVDYALGTGVEDREPVGTADSFDLQVGKVWAWIKVANSGDPSHVTMVWSRDGEESWRIKLDVGKSPAWRTWSRKTVRKWDAGIWTVDILAPDGTMLESLEFEVQATTPGDVAGG